MHRILKWLIVWWLSDDLAGCPCATERRQLVVSILALCLPALRLLHARLLLRNRWLALADRVGLVVLPHHGRSCCQNTGVAGKCGSALCHAAFLLRLLVRQIPRLWLLKLALVLQGLLLSLLVHLVDVLERLHVVFKLLLRDLVDLVHHEDVLLEAPEELVKARLGWSLRWLLSRGGACSRIH